MSTASTGVVLGVDIGTTSTKVVAYDMDGREHGSSFAEYPLEEPAPGQAVQDPDAILDAVRQSVRAVVRDLPDGTMPLGLSFSAAMHSLVGLDAAGRPLTPSLTWADARASAQAERLRAGISGFELYRRTGTPLHPMSPLTKLIWFHELEPKLSERVTSWVGIKEYVLLGICGALVIDHSVASATGLLDQSALEWDAQALEVAGITPQQLPELVPTTTVLPGVTAAAGEAMGLRRDIPVVVGASDGPLANLGVGAVRPGVAGCTIGTSGALRVMVEKPSVDPHGQVFCCALTEDRWVVGGAINNGGSVLQWAGDALAPELATQTQDVAEGVLELAARAPVGSGGLVMLPYLLSERAPYWSSVPARGAYVGLTWSHRREHLVRAALEGVCQQLALVLYSMQAAGTQVRELRATGGFARSPLWRQMLTDVLGRDVGFPSGHQGSSFGAALLGMQALGLIDSIDAAADLVEIEETRSPDPPAAATYAALFPTFSALYDALEPTFQALRRLTPSLPTTSAKATEKSA